jgi:alpha-1,6-mannosyltransferase
MPFLSYFTRFLPRILHFAYLLSIIGMLINPLDQLFLVPSIFYILFMSCLGHKEWRFIEYTFPLFSLSASVTSRKMYYDIQ